MRVRSGAEIKEAGLVIRAWRPSDVDEVFRACQDPDIQRWTPVPSPYLRQHAHGFITELAKKAWESGTGSPMGIFDPAGQLLGSVALSSIRRGESAEIGYWVAQWARGRAVATNAVRAVSRWAFDDLGLRRLVWRAEVGNFASRLVAEAVGYRVEGIMRNGADHRGRPIDCWAGALLPGQLREAGSPADPLRRQRALVFGQPQGRLAGQTPAGLPLSLRPFEPRDLDAVVAACRDPESIRWTTIPEPYRPEDADYFIRGHAPGCWARGDGAIFAVADADDSYVGSMDLRLGPGPDVADVGYLVAPRARGNGYAPAALRILVGWGVSALGLNRIEWRAYLGNHASRRVAEKAGFTIEGVARAGCVQRGAYRDAWTGAILAADLMVPVPADLEGAR